MHVTYDFDLAIALGKNRKDTSWKNRTVKWSDLLTKFSKTHYTAESHAEYLTQPKDRQDEIKDIGGFVGGTIYKGRRKKNNILYRSVVTLDVDFSNISLWEDFTFMYHNAAAIYTTHKHSADNPRYRLVLPLDREVFCDEYEAIARRIAGYLNIEIFDRTTFQPERLMYWPSTSKDAEFYFNYQDGPAICADEILQTYRDWRDTTQWPVCKAEKEAVLHGIKKAGDPTLKEGVIGAFCRQYSIQEAIQLFLSDVYEECVTDGRYTYLKGSTAGGLVIYEDLYAFSHHGTDPASMRLCNAFDLVRIHLFGLADEDRKPDTPFNKLPSYQKMLEFAAADPNVRQNLAFERLEQAQSQFENMPVPVITSPAEQFTKDNTEWLKELEYDKKGNIKQTIYNVFTVLSNDPGLKNKLAFDAFRQRRIIKAALPWHTDTPTDMFWKDEDDAALRFYMEKSYGLTSRLGIADALSSYFYAHTFHPVKEYLDPLTWDGVPRLDTLLIRYMGAEDTLYTRAVTRKTFIAAVARIYNPGVKFDYVLTLAGVEGTGKSTLIAKMGGEWFTDNFNTINGKEAKEQILGNWLIEMGEMAALKRAEVYSIKQFVASQEDSFRPAFGKYKIHVKRQCVFFATTNEIEMLRGADGNRRFWIIDVHGRKAAVDVKALQSINIEERAQLWAEAKFRFEQEEKLYLDDELEAIARIEQKTHGEQDERTGIIIAYLETKLPNNWYEMGMYERRAYLNNDIDIQTMGVIERTKVCVTEIWVEALGQNIKDLSPFAARPINDILKNLEGWEASPHKARFGNYGPQKAWIKSPVNIYA